jgi:hypothetical protein
MRETAQKITSAWKFVYLSINDYNTKLAKKKANFIKNAISIPQKLLILSIPFYYRPIFSFRNAYLFVKNKKHSPDMKKNFKKC